MNCPLCNIPLSISERQGIEIDYCSKCRGVWLDRGELDKIIERAAAEMPSRSYSEGQNDRYGHPRDEHRRDHYEDHQYKKHHHRKRSFLEDLFD